MIIKLWSHFCHGSHLWPSNFLTLVAGAGVQVQEQQGEDFTSNKTQAYWWIRHVGGSRPKPARAGLVRRLLQWCVSTSRYKSLCNGSTKLGRDRYPRRYWRSQPLNMDWVIPVLKNLLFSSHSFITFIGLHLSARMCFNMNLLFLPPQRSGLNSLYWELCIIVENGNPFLILRQMLRKAILPADFLHRGSGSTSLEYSGHHYVNTTLNTCSVCSCWLLALV